MDSYLFIALLSLREEAHPKIGIAAIWPFGDFLLAREENFHDCRRRKTTCDLLVLDVSE